jgi:hypothetical protein
VTAVDKAQAEACNRASLRQTAGHVVTSEFFIGSSCEQLS